jgi:hypothetical protein
MAFKFQVPVFSSAVTVAGRTAADRPARGPAQQASSWGRPVFPPSQGRGSRVRVRNGAAGAAQAPPRRPFPPAGLGGHSPARPGQGPGPPPRRAAGRPRPTQPLPVDPSHPHPQVASPMISYCLCASVPTTITGMIAIMSCIWTRKASSHKVIESAARTWAPKERLTIVC